MPDLKLDNLERYLASLLRIPVTVLGMAPLGTEPREQDVKGYGYGTPIRVDFEAGGARRTAVLHTITPGPFGHEHMPDRAQILLWEHQAFNRLPRHVPSLDVGVFQSDGALLSLGRIEEPFLLTGYAEGEGYVRDLERLRSSDALTPLDLERADALCDYLVEIHRVPGNNPDLYRRRIRELVGHGECIMGLTDSYPPHPLIPSTLLEQIEHHCVRWRWKLKPLTHRLRQVHGDFHPWNILFRSGADFSLLDRSRGEFGDPADDVTSLTMNYLFFSLQRSGRLEGSFATLFRRFWERYVEQSGDSEILRAAAPFFAFRGLVIASPLWYPALSDSVRRKLLSFVLAVLDADSFHPAEVNHYCGA
ncbi:MAG: phosphotransferase [Bryobacterales bacterium]|nr:phosphotransferase [Bryobacterales bacterium]